MDKKLYLVMDHELTDFEFGFLLGYEICKIKKELEEGKQKLKKKTIIKMPDKKNIKKRG